jgi:hypothetical protein
MFFCLYRWAGDLVFRAGARTWSLSRDDLGFAFSRLSSARSRFCVVEGGGETFRSTYTHVLRTFFAGLDVTYDGLDFDNDHFLARVATISLPATVAHSPGWQGWLDGARAAHPRVAADGAALRR